MGNEIGIEIHANVDGDIGAPIQNIFAHMF